MSNRGIRKQIWLNRDEDLMLKRKAEIANMNASELIRSLIMGYEPQAKPPIEFYEMIKQLRKLGSNLNQIAMKAHGLGFIDELSYKKEVEKIDSLILEMKRQFLLPKKVEEKNAFWGYHRNDADLTDQEYIIV